MATDKAVCRRSDSRGEDTSNLVWKQDFEMVTSLGAVKQPQGSTVQQATHGGPSGAEGDTDAAGEPSQRKAETRLAFQATVAQEIGVDGAVDDVEGEARNE